MDLPSRTWGGVRSTIEPGKVNRVTIMAPKAGTYEFHCDLFCGEGHEGMTGTIIVEDWGLLFPMLT
jgi:cytochrome c oxidase subunit II